MTPITKHRLARLKLKTQPPVHVNLKSRFRTPASIAYDMHWQLLQLEKRWEWDRFARLAAFLQHTVYELASLVMMDHEEVTYYRDHNQIHRNPFIAGRTALILTMLEAHVMGKYTNDVVLDPFPKEMTGSLPNSNG